MSERMTPAQETLCAVMEAWGARYSDSPIVLGLSPSRAAMAPKGVFELLRSTLRRADKQSYKPMGRCVQSPRATVNADSSSLRVRKPARTGAKPA